MSAEDFQLMDESKTDDSITKRDFIKIYHQHGAEVKIENQNINFYFGKYPTYIEKGNGYVEVDLEVKKVDNTIFTIADDIRVVNNAIALIFKEAQLSKTSGTRIEDKNI